MMVTPSVPSQDLYDGNRTADARAEKTYSCMKAAYDVGINFFDTAEGYEAGKSEIIMGQAIKKFGWKQQDLVISTKVLFDKKTSWYCTILIKKTDLPRPRKCRQP